MNCPFENHLNNSIFIILIELGILSIANLCCYVPTLLALITKSQYLHSDITSDIPGKIFMYIINLNLIKIYIYYAYN
jgi:hypothetical protein